MADKEPSKLDDLISDAKAGAAGASIVATVGAAIVTVLTLLKDIID